MFFKIAEMNDLMLREYHNALEQLRLTGWNVSLKITERKLPEGIKARFGWLPQDIEEFIVNLEAALSPDEKVWLLGMPDFTRSGVSAFKWNEWEQMSLAAAESNPQLITSVVRFWDSHFPIALSVKSGYAYFAIRKMDLSIVCGEEPEFEESSVVASSFLELLELLVKHDIKLSRWI
jgi:hypothetical protein